MFQTIKYLIAVSLVAGLCNPIYAASPSDWSAKFVIGPKHTVIISHTPKQVCFDNMICSAGGIYFGANMTVNNITINDCALDLKVAMTKKEFVDAMVCSGLAPIEKK